MLTIRDVKKTFLRGTPDEKLAVDGLCLHLEAGEFATIIGGNGAGKSTLFNLVSGFLRPDAGRIELDGVDITNMPEHKRAFYMGRLFQDPLKGTAPSMTIEENLSLAYLRGKRRGLRPGLDKRNRQFFTQRLAELGLGLEDRLRAPVGTLSGGQRQAITLLMATIAAPKLLLLDEHTAALDPATAEKVLGLTRDIVERHGITTLMITHDIPSALSIGSRTLMMDSGRVVLDIDGQERKGLTVEDVLRLYKQRGAKGALSDRSLLV